MLKGQETNSYLGTSFDFDDLMGYKGMIESLCHNESFLDLEIGDPNDLLWDYDFLMTTMQLINQNHSAELERINVFSNFWMVFDFISEATTYALINNKQQVGQEEMIRTFKYWEYLPFNLRLDILDDLFTQENIDYSNHPFQISHPRKQPTYQKIIPFRAIKKETE